MNPRDNEVVEQAGALGVEQQGKDWEDREGGVWRYNAELGGWQRLHNVDGQIVGMGNLEVVTGLAPYTEFVVPEPVSDGAE